MLSLSLALNLICIAAPIPKFNDAPNLPYVPTKPGSTWEYVENDKQFEIVLTEVSHKDGITLLVYKLNQDKQLKVFEQQRVLNKAVYMTHNIHTKLPVEICILKTDMNAGDSWKVENVGGVIEEFKVGDDKKIITRAGTFLSTPVNWIKPGSKGNTKGTNWYSKEYGLIKVEYQSGTTCELVNVRINNK